MEETESGRKSEKIAELDEVPDPVRFAGFVRAYEMPLTTTLLKEREAGRFQLCEFGFNCLDFARILLREMTMVRPHDP